MEICDLCNGKLKHGETLELSMRDHIHGKVIFIHGKVNEREVDLCRDCYFLAFMATGGNPGVIGRER